MTDHVAALRDCKYPSRTYDAIEQNLAAAYLELRELARKSLGIDPNGTLTYEQMYAARKALRAAIGEE